MAQGDETREIEEERQQNAGQNGHSGGLSARVTGVGELTNGFDLNQMVRSDLVALAENDLPFFELSKDVIDISCIFFLPDLRQ